MCFYEEADGQFYPQLVPVSETEDKVRNMGVVNGAEICTKGLLFGHLGPISASYWLMVRF